MIFSIFLHLPYGTGILGDFAASHVIITTHCLFECNQPLNNIPSHFSFLHFSVDSQRELDD